MAAKPYYVANLLNTLAPMTAAGRLPEWRPPAPAELRKVMNAVHLPHPLDVRDIRNGESLVAITPNAPLLTALYGGEHAGGRLEQTRDPEPRVVHPGYYLVEAHEWKHGTPGSPLGVAPVGSRVWVTHDTYRLLRSLTHGSRWATPGHWPDATVHDSWISEHPVRFTDWSRTIRDLRTSILATADNGAGEEDYDALRAEFLSAVADWMEEQTEGVFRPDWYHGLIARSAYTVWRAAYIATTLHHPPAAVGGDQIVFRTGDLTALLAKPEAIISLDRTGQRWGTYKPVRRYFAGEELE